MKPVECINPPKDKWRVRWDFLPTDDGGVSYEEAEFDHEPTEDEIDAAKQKTLEQLRAGLAATIADHDKSEAVNSFRVEVAGVGGIGMWLSREERLALRIRFEAEQRAGVAATTLWTPDGLSLTVSPMQGLGMLDALELYAAACYDRTQQHLLAASGLGSRAECDEYDCTAGYPEKLTFNM